MLRKWILAALLLTASILVLAQAPGVTYIGPTGTTPTAGKCYFYPDYSKFVVSTGATLDVESGGVLKIAGVQITATAAETNYLHGVTPGTAAASKVAILGANKNLDELHLAALYLGAGAGTAVTSTAAEVNTLHGVTAGTAAASSAVVLDSGKAVAGMTLTNISVPNSGTAPIAANSTLTAGTVTIATTAATVNSTVYVCYKTPKTTAAPQLAYSVTPGVSITITNGDAADDTSVVSYIIVN